MTFTPQPGSDVEPRTPISPTAPPPALGRVPTIALPPTPTQRWFDPSSQSSESDIALSRKRSLLHFPSITMPTPSASEILSPIHVTTPTPGLHAPSASGGPSPLYQSHVPPAETQPASSSTSASASGSTRPPLPAPIARKSSGPKPVLEIQTNGISPPSSKGKAKETQADLDTKAANFLRGSLLVRHCWETWRHRRETTKAWVEACKRSEIYKDKVQRGRIPATMSASVMREKPDQSLKKRRISAPTELATSQIRRLKRRKSNQFAQPLTDEALARRLQEVCRCLPSPP